MSLELNFNAIMMLEYLQSSALISSIGTGARLDSQTLNSNDTFLHVLSISFVPLFSFLF